MSGTTHLRPATPDEAETFSAFCARTFSAAYAGMVPAAALDAYVREAFTPARQRQELEDPDTTVFVAERDGATLGYVLVHREDPPPTVTGRSPLAVGRIYVEPAAQGSGTGTALMRRAISHARAAGHDRLWLTVWERNTRAIAVYERWGFSDAGPATFDFAGDVQIDRVMVRPVVAQLG